MTMDLQLAQQVSNFAHVFPGAYGGYVGSSTPPQIHDMMRKLRIEIGAVEAKKSTDQYGPKFPVRGAKDLAQKLANALNALNMEAPVVDQQVTLIDTDKIPKNENKSGNPVFRTLAHVKSVVRLIAPDTSFIDLVGSGHGGDVDDKSGGKASTYAWKDAILKGLSIPHEDMVDTDDDSSTGDGESGAGGKGRGRAAKEGGAGKMGEGAGGKASGGAGSGRGEVSVGASGEAVQQLVSDGGSQSTSGATVGGGLAAVTAAIKAADTDPALEAVREDIKAGKYELHGADKLKATQIFVAQKKVIKEKNA